MNTQVSATNTSVMAMLNSNRITEKHQKEAIKAMGMSACQVRCLSHQCSGHYHSKH